MFTKKARWLTRREKCRWTSKWVTMAPSTQARKKPENSPRTAEKYSRVRGADKITYGRQKMTEMRIYKSELPETCSSVLSRSILK